MLALTFVPRKFSVFRTGIRPDARVRGKCVWCAVMNQSSPTDSSDSSASASPETISRRAYELWEKDGRPEGSDLRHWLQAEQELRTSSSSNGSKSQGSSPSRAT